jgi:hypothetical protein
VTAVACAPARLNGCHNHAPFLDTLEVQDGWTPGVYDVTRAVTTRAPRMITVPFRMARDCRYTHTDLGKADAACAGCTWRAPA